MKILHRGRLDAEVEHTATCQHCGTKISFLESEAKLVADPREGDYLSVVCPVCFKVINKSVMK